MRLLSIVSVGRDTLLVVLEKYFARLGYSVIPHPQ